MLLTWSSLQSPDTTPQFPSQSNPRQARLSAGQNMNWKLNSIYYAPTTRTFSLCKTAFHCIWSKAHTQLQVASVAVCAWSAGCRGRWRGGTCGWAGDLQLPGPTMRICTGPVGQRASSSSTPWGASQFTSVEGEKVRESSLQDTTESRCLHLLPSTNPFVPAGYSIWKPLPWANTFSSPDQIKW